MAFQTSGFARFMVSAAGRWLRIIAGAALIFWGWSMHSGAGMIVMVVGLVPACGRGLRLLPYRAHSTRTFLGPANPGQRKCGQLRWSWGEGFEALVGRA